MSAGEGAAVERSILIGTDQVYLGQTAVAILAVRENEGWTVREFSRMGISLEGKFYRLLHRTAAEKPFAWRYDLVEWTDPQPPHHYVQYDEQYVHERNRGQRSDRTLDLINTIVKPFYPFLGFAWSGFKERVLVPCGYNARSITSASLMIETGFFMLESIFVLHLRNGFLMQVLSSEFMGFLDIFLFLFMPIDLIIRTNQVMRGDEFPIGFMEWAVPRILRRKSPE